MGVGLQWAADGDMATQERWTKGRGRGDGAWQQEGTELFWHRW